MTTLIDVPGAEPVMLYQPKHPIVYSGRATLFYPYQA